MGSAKVQKNQKSVLFKKKKNSKKYKVKKVGRRDMILIEFPYF